MSLVVVLTALPARMAAVTAADLGAHWSIAANLLAGSLLSAVLAVEMGVDVGAGAFELRWVDGAGQL